MTREEFLLDIEKQIATFMLALSKKRPKNPEEGVNAFAKELAKVLFDTVINIDDKHDELLLQYQTHISNFIENDILAYIDANFEPVIEGNDNASYYYSGQKTFLPLPSSTGNLTIFNEIPTGAIDGSNAVFTTANDFESGSTQVFVKEGGNGALLMLDLGIDYSETDTDEITLSWNPSASSVIKMNYIKA